MLLWKSVSASRQRLGAVNHLAQLFPLDSKHADLDVSPGVFVIPTTLVTNKAAPVALHFGVLRERLVTGEDKDLLVSSRADGVVECVVVELDIPDAISTVERLVDSR